MPHVNKLRFEGFANKETQPKWEEAKILITPHTEYMLDTYEKIMILKFGDNCINALQKPHKNISFCLFVLG